jgi:fimbrial chaperone protein
MSTRTTLRLALLVTMLPLAAAAGSLRVGPTRVDLSPRHPVAVLEVENTGDSATLAQVDRLAWSQNAGEESLEPTPDLIATPLVMNLAPGATQKVRVGLRDLGGPGIERSYRVIVGEVTPTFVASAGLRFAVRVSVPVFASTREPRPGSAQEAPVLNWKLRPDIEGCGRIEVSNESDHHEHVIYAELLAAAGRPLWDSGSPDYVLAGAQRSLTPPVCAPASSQNLQLRLTTEPRTITLPAPAGAMLAESKPE